MDSVSTGVALLEPAYDNLGAIPDFNVVLFNSHVLQWMEEPHYQGKTYGEIFPVASQSGIIDKFRTAFETKEPIDFEQSFEGPQLAWFQFYAERRDELLVVTLEDITHRKYTETALQAALETSHKQKRLYDSITNNTPDLVYVFDLSYKFTYANKALLDMWGKTAEDAIGKGLRENGYEEWHAKMHEGEIDEIVRTKKSIRGAVMFPHAEFGKRIYDYILVPVLSTDGQVEAIAGTTRDITDLKLIEEKLVLSENRLKLVIDQTPAPTLVLMGDDLVIEQINKPMLQMIGRAEEVTGMPMIEVLPELKGSYIWDQVLKVYHQGVPFDHPEVLVSHKRGGDAAEDFYYNLSYRPLHDAGKIVGMIQVAVDVTVQVNARKKTAESETRYRGLSKSLEQQVQSRTSELQRSNEDLQQFAHVASHDLKEPVRKIKMFTSRLEEHLFGNTDASALKFIEKIHSSTDRMFAMIDGVLAYSTANASVQLPEPVDLEETIQNIEFDLEVPLQKTQGIISHNNLPVIEGASVLLYQLFYNLINNSIKFAKAGVAPVIHIEAAQTPDPDFIEITVSDNGIGFDPAYAQRIFETFTRLNPKDRYEGTGLGLSLCKKIVERHGGKITASSSDGAVFTILLPKKQHGSI
ncbi:MAG: PAS domain S-box protein [Proteobacteria bacterium]|nr:MAG: PAS domain S-box protein [Pseudomonadota bacterium]